jgi:DNA-binding response OmpR family regulator
MPVPRLLIVDDEPNQRRALSIALRLEGFEVETAATAVEGLDILRTSPVDIALIDLMMPGVNGLEMARQMRSLYPGVPVVLTSAYHLSERQLARSESGVVGFVPKPCPMNEVAAFLHAKVRLAAARPPAALAPEALVPPRLSRRGASE